MHKENDNLDIEEIERYRQMKPEERKKLMEEMERKVLEERKQYKK